MSFNVQAYKAEIRDRKARFYDIPLLEKRRMDALSRRLEQVRLDAQAIKDRELAAAQRKADETRLLELAAFLNGRPVRKPTGRMIMAAIASKHQITINDLLSHRRLEDLVYARQEAMWTIRQETSLSMPQIGRLFDRDHTTVIHACRAHEIRIKGGSYCSHRLLYGSALTAVARKVALRYEHICSSGHQPQFALQPRDRDCQSSVHDRIEQYFAERFPNHHQDDFHGPTICRS